MAKMPFYAKLQNRRLRNSNESATRANSLWAFFNSSFGLWLLSAVFVTVGGSYINARYECLLSARSDIDEYNQLSGEIATRRRRIILAIQRTSNAIDFWNAAHSNTFSNFKQYDGQPLASLIARRRQLDRKIQGIKPFFATDFPTLLKRAGYLQVYAILEGGVLPESFIDDKKLIEAKKYVNDMGALPGDVDLLFGVLRPNCSLKTLLSGSLTDSEQQNITYQPRHGEPF